jgi:hypothetical protein
MTEEAYMRRRAVIEARIIRHERRLADGRHAYPKCLAADYRELEKLNREYEDEKTAK